MTGQKLERLQLVTGLVLKQSQQALGLLTAKIADIDKKLQQLSAMRGALSRLVATCARRGTTSACPILDSLDMRDDA